MSTFHIRSQDSGSSGVFARVRPQQVGLELLNLAALRLQRGQVYSTDVGDHEHVSLVLAGRCRVTLSGKAAGAYDLGRRPSVFQGMPHALYLPRGTTFSIEALSEVLELACCWVPTDQDHPVHLIRPWDCSIEIRGGGNATSQINTIIGPNFSGHRLMCCETYTPSGNWSSYPPHKYDTNLEALCLYKFCRGSCPTVVAAPKSSVASQGQAAPLPLQGQEQGFALHRLYSPDREEEQSVIVRNHDIVLVSQDYQAVASGHGYITYSLQFMAGSARSLAQKDDPAHSWVRQQWGQPDPRLPVVHHGMEV